MSKIQLNSPMGTSTPNSTFCYPKFCEQEMFAIQNDKIPKKFKSNVKESLSHRFRVMVSLVFLVLAIGSNINAQCTINTYVPANRHRIECVNDDVWFRVNYTISSAPVVTWQYNDDGIGDPDGPDNLTGYQPVSGSGIAHTVDNNFAGAYARLNLLNPGTFYYNYQFRVVFSGTPCSPSVESLAFDYTLNGPFSIITQPSAADICETTTSQVFSVGASNSGSGSLTYLWQYGASSTGPWNNMTATNASGSGFNTASLSLNNTHTSIWPASGSSVFVRCRVGLTGCNNEFSDAVELSIDQAPSVSVSDDVTICSTSTTNLSATLGGSATSLTWSGTGTFDDANANPVMYSNSTPGTYSITATTNVNGACLAESASVDVTVDNLSILSYSPASKTATRCHGQSQTFTISTSGTGSITYQWQEDSGSGFANISGEESASLVINPVSASMHDNTYRCVVTNGECTLISEAFTLNVDGPITITTHPVSVTDICITQDNATFSVAATTGSGTLTYQWQQSLNGTSGWTNIIGETNTTLVIPNTSPYWPGSLGGSHYFRCVVDAGVCSAVNSSVAQLMISIQGPVTVNAGPDAFLCKDATSSALNGSVSPTNVGTWTSNVGGTFSDASAPTASTFLPPAGFTGEATLTLTSFDPAGPCPVVTDDVVITVVGVDVGDDLASCYDDAVNISASITGTADMAGTWAVAAGDGSFTDATATSTAYTPGATDNLETLSFTHTASGCSDNLTLTVNKITLTTSIKLRTICEGSTLPSLTPFRQSRTTYLASNGNTDVWEYSVDGSAPWMPVASLPNAGTTLPTVGGNNSRTDLYFAGPVPASYNGYNFRVKITEGECQETVDGFFLTVNTTPTVDLGADITVCYNSGDVTLSPVLGGGATLQAWNILSGAGSMTGDVYTPAAADAGNTVMLRYETVDPTGPCPADLDTILITFDHITISDHVPVALVRNSCEGSNTNFRINYTSTPAATITWEYRTSPSGSWSDASAIGTVTSPGGNTQLNLTAVTTAQSGFQFRAVFDAGTCQDINSDIFTLNVGANGTIDAGDPQTICVVGDDVSISGTLTGGYVNINTTWTAVPGGGTFGDEHSLATTYQPSPADIANGSVTLTLTTANPPGGCGVISDNVIITILANSGDISAGPDGNVCSGQSYNMAGSFSPPVTSTTWTTTGTGLFFDPLSPGSTTYTPSAADIAAGQVKLILTSNNVIGGTCMIHDTMVLTIETIDILSYDPSSKTVSTCDGESVTLAVTTETVTSPNYQWFRRLGSATEEALPSSNALSYTFNAAALDSGYVYYMKVSAAGCMSTSDSFHLNVNGPISFDAHPINVGPLCNSTTTASFSATATSTKGLPALQWQFATTSGGTFTNIAGYDATTGTLNLDNTASFWPGLGQAIYLRLKASLPGCDPVYSNVASLSIDAVGPAIVNAGPDQTIVCNGSNVITLAGSVSGTGTSAMWMSSTGGAFSDANAPSGVPGFPSTYTLTNAEMLSGSVTLTLTSNNPTGACPAVSDQMVITINNVGSVNAGADMIVCSGAAPVSISGTVAPLGYSTTWSSSGSGGFAIASLLMTTYSPSTSDRSAGSVTLTLTRNATATCPAISDQKVLTISNTAGITAGSDATICLGSSYTLDGTFNAPATSMTWSVVSGPNMSSTQFADVHDPDTQFTPTVGGTYTLQITSNPGLPGACPVVSDQVVITVESIVISSTSSLTPHACVGSTLSMNVNFSGSTGSNTSYTRQWQYMGKSNVGVLVVTWANVTGSNHNSASGQTTQSFSFVPTFHQNGNQYRLRITKNGCEQISNVFTINIPASVTGFASSTSDLLNQCSNLASATFNTTFTENDPLGNSDVELRWQSSTNGTSGWADVPTTVTGYNTTNVTIENGGALWPAVGSSIYFRLIVKTSIGGGSQCTYTSNLSKQLQITYQAPLANAGNDVSSCGTTPVTLAGSFSGSATSATWTSGGTGSFVDPNFVGTTYTPSAADVAAGMVTLTLTTNDPSGTCGTHSDQLILTLGNGQITGGSALAITRCNGANATFRVDFSSPSLQLPSSIVWSMNGSPVAGSNFTVLDAGSATQSRLRVEDVTGLNGSTFTVEVTYPGCTPETRTYTLTVTDGPTADPGTYAPICAGSVIALDGTIGGSATTGTWSTSGDGGFSNVDVALADASYTPGSGDIAAGMVTLTLTSNGAVGGCPVISENVIIEIDNITPNAITPATQTQCDGETVTVTATWSLGTGTPSSSTSWEYNDGSGWTPFTAGTINNTTEGTSVLTFTATAAMNGYMLRAIISAGACTKETSGMTLTVNGPITFDTHPTSLLNQCQNITSASFTASAMNTGAGTMTYRWMRSDNGTSGWMNVASSVDGFNTTTLTVDNTDGVAWPTIGSTSGKYYRLSANLSGCTNFYTSNVAQFTISNDPAPTVTTPASAIQCKGTTVALSGSIGGSATSATWTTSGSGTIDLPGNFASATYTPGANETGDVTFILTSNDPINNVCTSAISSFIITYIDVNAGIDINVCKDGNQLSPITLGGSVIGMSSPAVTWSDNGAGGTFLPDASTLAATYTPTSDASPITLTLTSNTCSDNVMVIFNENIVISTTPGTVTECVGDNVNLTVAFTPDIAAPALTRVWQYNDDAAGDADGMAGFQNLTISSPYSVTTVGSQDTRLVITGLTSALDNMQYRVALTNGACTATSSAFTLRVNNIISSSAGSDVAICETATSAMFAGTSTATGPSTTGHQWRWSTSPAGTYSNVSGAGASGQTTQNLTLSSTWGNWPAVGTPIYLRLRVSKTGCSSLDSDPIAFTRDQAPVVTAGSDVTICETGTTTLAGTMAGSATSITWTSDKLGTFDDATSLGAVYTPGEPGVHTLTITSDDPAGTCPAASDVVVITVEDLPVLNAGLDQAVCQLGGPNAVQLNGSVTPATASVSWTAPSGTFDDGSLLNALYTPDGTSQQVTLTLTAAAQLACPAVTDQVIISLGDGIVLSSYTPGGATAGIRTICNGGSTTFRVDYDATVLATHQWQVWDGSSFVNLPIDATAYGIGGWTVNSDDQYVQLSLTGLNVGANGRQFRVIVTDRGCSATFGDFTLNVNGPVSFSTLPASQTVCMTATMATFTGVAVNSGAGGSPTYQWQYYNGSSWVNVPNTVAGYNGTSLFLTNAASFWPPAGSSVDLRLNATIPICGTTSSPTATLTRTNVPCDAQPDLTPTIPRPLNLNFTAGQTKEGYIQIENVGAASTSGTITFSVSKVNNFTLNIPSGMTTAAGTSVNNSDWTITAGLFSWIITAPANVIAPTGNSKIGFTLTRVGATGTTGTMTVTITSGTGGDSNNTNNIVNKSFSNI